MVTDPVSSNGHDADMTIKQAAEALGITPLAVRRRLTRGKLPGYKDAFGQWRVTLPEEDLVRERVSANGHELGQEQSRGGEMTEVVTSLKDEVHFLRAELERRNEELRRVGEERVEAERRRDILFAQFTDQLRSLTTTTSPSATPEPGPTPPPKRSWWRTLFGSVEA